MPIVRLDDQLCFALYAASHATTAAYREALRDAGLTYPQYLVMLALWETDGLTVGELGQRMHLDSGTLSPLVSRLEAAGLLTRSRGTHDARRVVVSLTETGDALRSEAERVQCALLRPLDLDTDDLVLLRELARRLTASLERSTSSPPHSSPSHPTPSQSARGAR